MRSARLPWLRLLSSIAVAALLIVPQIAIAPAANAYTTLLPMQHGIFDILVDGANDHVFISSGTGQSALTVLDYAGTELETLSIPGASGMALVGSTLFVAAADADEIVTIDTTAVPPSISGHLAIGSFTHPESVAYVGGSRWFSTGVCGSGTVQHAHMDTDGTNLSTAVSLEADTCPRYVVSPSDPNLLLMFDDQANPMVLSEYDMSTDPPTLLVGPASVNGGKVVSDVAFAPAGASFFTASTVPDTYDQVKTSDLSLIRSYFLESHGGADAVDATATGGGRLVGGGNAFEGSSVWVYDIGSVSPTNSFDLPGEDVVVPRGVAWADDGTSIFAVVSHAWTDPLQLYVLDPAAIGSTMELTATPTDTRVGEKISLAGSLTFDDASTTAGQTMTVWRWDPNGMTVIGDVTVAADGTFHLHTPAHIGGTATYTASFAGAAHYKPSEASDSVNIAKLRSHVSVEVSDTAVPFGHAVRVTGHLGAGTMSRRLELYAKPDGGHKILIRKGKVDRHRNLSTSYTPNRDTTFFAYFDGDLKHRPDEDSAVTRVRVILHAKLTKFVSTSGKYKIYRGGTYAHCVVHVAPNHAGSDIHVTMQGYVNGHWKVFDTDAFPLNRKSNLEFVLYGSSNVNFRAKAKLPTHKDHLGDSSPWLYFRFK